jgi:hypothetical protein
MGDAVKGAPAKLESDRHRTPRCNQPDPDQPDIRCDYEAGHRLLDATGDNRPPTIYDHGNSTARHWWTSAAVVTEQAWLDLPKVKSRPESV